MAPLMLTLHLAEFFTTRMSTKIDTDNQINVYVPAEYYKQD